MLCQWITPVTGYVYDSPVGVNNKTFDFSTPPLRNNGEVIWFELVREMPCGWFLYQVVRQNGTVCWVTYNNTIEGLLYDQILQKVKGQ